MIDTKIIKIASNTKNYGLIKKNTKIVSCKNKLCGDTIRLEIKKNKKKIIFIRYEMNACIFCQASASLLSQSIVNLGIIKTKTDINKLLNLLNKQKDLLPTKFKKFKTFFNIKYINRYECVKLPIKAVLKAIAA